MTKYNANYCKFVNHFQHILAATEATATANWHIFDMISSHHDLLTVPG